MQITLDVSTLTAAERSHVIQFIADYPTQDNASFDEINRIPAFTIPVYDEDAEEELPPAPEVAFGLALVPPPPPVLQVTAPSVTIPAGHALSAAVAAITAAPAGVTFDKNGLPWDDRIHSSNKAFVADGTWRKRRGVDDAVVAQVEAELRAIMNIPAPSLSHGSFPSAAATPPVQTVIASVPPPPPFAPVIAATTTAPATASVPPPPPPPPSPVASAPVEPNAYLNLIQLVTDVISKKMITRPQVDACITGVDPSLNLQLLSKRPDLIPQIAANIRSLVA